MASLESVFRAAITADATVAGLISDRLYLIQLPQNPVFPCAWFQRIATSPIYTHQLGGTQASMGWCRFQVDVAAQQKVGGVLAGEQTDQIARAIVAALQTFNASAQPESPVVLRQAPNLLLSRRMWVEPNTQPPLFRARLDVRLFYQEN